MDRQGLHSNKAALVHECSTNGNHKCHEGKSDGRPVCSFEIIIGHSPENLLASESIWENCLALPVPCFISSALVPKFVLSRFFIQNDKIKYIALFLVWAASGGGGGVKCVNALCPPRSHVTSRHASHPNTNQKYGCLIFADFK